MSSSAALGAKSASAACARAGGHVLGATLAVAAAAEELDAVGDDLDRLALGAVLRLPLAPVEAPVDRHRPALGQVLRAVLALLAPDGDREVVRLVDPLAALVLAPRVDGDTQRADRHAGRRVPELRVAGEVADENHAVDAGGHRYSSSSSLAGAVSASSLVGAPTATGSAGPPCRPTCRHVAHDGVVDLQHPGDLVERVGRAREEEQVVAPVAPCGRSRRRACAGPTRRGAPTCRRPSRQVADARRRPRVCFSSLDSGSSRSRISYSFTSPWISFLRSEAASPPVRRPGAAARGEAGSRRRVAAVASSGMRRALAWTAGIVGIAALARLATRACARGPDARRRSLTPIPPGSCVERSSSRGPDRVHEPRRDGARQRRRRIEERRADVHARAESAIARMREGDG